MQAFQLVAPQQPPELRVVPVPEPGPGQVLVKVGGAGACHSDLHLMEAPAERLGRVPFTLGHENAGWVEKLGPGATGFAPGDPVLVYGPWGCGTCANCRLGMENYCEATGGLGGGLAGNDGGMAPYLLVPATRFLIPLGSLDPREAAPLTDAALTSYHAVKRSLHLLGPGSTAVVIGAGGLGQMAIQILRALSSSTTVVAVDTAADNSRPPRAWARTRRCCPVTRRSPESRTSRADKAHSSSWTWSEWTRLPEWPRRWPGCVAT